MMVRFKFPSVIDAERAAALLPADCKWSILRDCTTNAYLEIPETFEEFIESYICNVTNVNSKGNRKGGVL